MCKGSSKLVDSIVNLFGLREEKKVPNRSGNLLRSRIRKLIQLIKKIKLGVTCPIRVN